MEEVVARSEGDYGSQFEDHPMRTAWLNTHPDKYAIAQRFRKRLQAQGHDGVLYRNEYEKTNKGSAANTSAIVFNPRDAEITQHHHADDFLTTEEKTRHLAKLWVDEGEGRRGA